MTRLFLLVTALGVCGVLSAAPQVSGITVSQNADTRLVTVGYTVSDGPAIVTATMKNGDARISGSALRTLRGDVGVEVASGGHSFTWMPDVDLPGTVIDPAAFKVELTAWSVKNPPDYLVASLVTNAPNKIVYYASADDLPGGLTDNFAYRTTKMVYRRIHAKGVEWLMGSVGEAGRAAASEKAHLVTLDHDYYLGVFELTQGQYSSLRNGSDESSAFPIQGRGRPLSNIPLSAVRGDADEPSATAMLNARAHCGATVDLPSEAEWEYAARAGNFESRWGDGSALTGTDGDTNLLKIARFATNSGGWVPSGTSGPDQGPAIVGSYAPNAWGLYDMHGNIGETCLDRYADDISENHTGTVRTAASGNRVLRGGHFASKAGGCRSATRTTCDPTLSQQHYGYRFRLPCPVVKLVKEGN